jgi:hypothetical protein
MASLSGKAPACASDPTALSAEKRDPMLAPFVMFTNATLSQALMAKSSRRVQAR